MKTWEWIPREKVQNVRVEGCTKNDVRDCGSWGEKHRIETEYIYFQKLLLSIYQYTLYIKLNNTLDKFPEPDLRFFYFSPKLYSLELLEKMETMRTNLPHYVA